MPEKALIVGGVARLVWVESLSEDSWQSEMHQYRREGVVKRRMYYDRRQYDGDNVEKKNELWPGLSSTQRLLRRLPEHQRKHAYSQAIEEGIDFLADQIAGTARIEAQVPQVQVFVDRLFDLARTKNRWQEVVQDMLIAGDVFARLVPVTPILADDPHVRVEFWQAEDVEIDYDEDDWTEMVEVRFERFKNEPDENGDMREVRYVHQFKMLPVIDDTGEVRTEAYELVFRGDLDAPVETIPLGLPFLPWVHLTGERQELRSMWGKPVISGNLMETADRYNAVCQLEFMAVRYNATAHLGVVGDAAHLSLRDPEYQIAADIADVLSFPGGTSLESLVLPTDVTLIQSQKETLLNQMFDSMGLERLDLEVLKGHGNLSGYALEILNRKTDGTFDRIIENLTEGVEELVEKALLVHAYTRDRQVIVYEVEGEQVVSLGFWKVDPDAVWPDRRVMVSFGSVYIVDEVANRDDFVAGMISRQEALRRSGRSDGEIARIMREIEEEQGQAEESLATSIAMGTRVSTERG